MNLDFCHQRNPFSAQGTRTLSSRMILSIKAHVLTQLRWIFLSILSTITSCDHRPLHRPESNLPIIDLTLSPSALSELETTVAGKNEVPARIRSGSHSWHGMISYAGKSSLYHRKRGYQARGLSGKIAGLKNFRLSAQVSDASMLRNVLTFFVYESLGIYVPKTEFVEIYVNQNFHGLYLLIEEVDQDFFKKRNVAVDSIYKARFGRLGAADLNIRSIHELHIGYNVVLGDERMFDLKALIMGIRDFQSGGDQTILDWNETAKYHAASVFLKHWDGFKNNYILYRSPTSPTFHWVPWDGDQVLQDDLFKGDFTPENSLWGFNEISVTLKAHRSLCLTYLDQLQTLIRQFDPSTLRQWLRTQAEKTRYSFLKDPVLNQLSQENEIEKIIVNADLWIKILQENLEKTPCPGS